MKFHNVRPRVYADWMNSAAPRTLLARLRTSARLAMLVLLVFALKIGTAAACAKHDFSDLGLGSDSSHAATMKAPQGDGGDTDPAKTKLGHANPCSHCGCHHAAAMVPDTQVVAVPVPQALPVGTPGLPPSASQPLELRPPIA